MATAPPSLPLSASIPTTSSPLSASIPTALALPPTTLSAPPSTFPHYITTKSTQDNYLVWRAQVQTYLYGQELFRYVDGSAVRPPQLLPTGLPNRDYLKWFQQDQLALSILLASLSDGIISQYVRHKSSHEMWLALETSFAQKTQARLVYLHQQLTTLKKGGESIQQYYQRATILDDSLAAAGKPVANDDFITYLLAGLGFDYDIIVTVLSTQRHLLSVEAILSHLLTFEERMTQQNSISLPTDISTNVVSFVRPPFTTSSRIRGGRYSGSGRYNGNIGRGYGRSYRGTFRGRGGARYFRGGHFQPNNEQNTPTPCQICLQYGHTALTCHQRTNHAFQAPPPLSFEAHYSEYPIDDTLWYPDTGATHHMTNNFSNLNLRSNPYQGQDTVTISNGAHMSITHHGSSTLHTTSGNFLLSNVLHIPEITKNLLSVHQFCRDNNVFFEFHSGYFCVKDERTKQLLLQGPSLKHLYPVTTPQAHFSACSSFIQWH
ncbi:hypothetical protein QN277_020616 [Acacia crassicarpa]|uniref:Retrovirus-related Pol polyprotein from transposon TNT 1-94-like beta-barrel domain-containing protein n=1 Tax=Acacia crassicarpa TaxID=499986 RepID=A0AAE1JJU7_9FABA|nr:hypothetical protein QN277_020616 [Acacia crassicarpa]